MLVAARIESSIASTTKPAKSSSFASATAATFIGHTDPGAALRSEDMGGWAGSELVRVAFRISASRGDPLTDTVQQGVSGGSS